MDIRQEILEYIEKFAIKNEDVIRKQFKPFKETSPSNSFDYLPPWNSNVPKNEDPLFHPLVEELSKKVFTLIFGEKPEDITFNLQGHMDEIDGKKWSEVNKIEKKKLWTFYSFADVMTSLKRMVFLDMIDVVLIKEENINMRLFNIRRNKVNGLFESCNCKTCDKNVNIFFNFESGAFESNSYVGKCSRVSPVINFNLTLPSNKLVILNDIRSLFMVNREDENRITINSIEGKVLECQEYLKHNIAYISLSSGSVEVVKNKSKRMVGFDYCHDHFYDDEKLKTDFKFVGEVFLELWAVFMLDYEHYKSLCEAKGVELDAEELSPIYIEVENDSLKVEYDLKKYLLKAKY